MDSNQSKSIYAASSLAAIVCAGSLVFCSARAGHTAGEANIVGSWSGSLVYPNDMQKPLKLKITAQNGVLNVRAIVTEPGGAANTYPGRTVLNNNKGAFFGPSGILFTFTYRPNGHNSEIVGAVIRPENLSDAAIQAGKRPLNATFTVTRDDHRP